MQYEHEAIRIALSNFDQLELFGGAIWVNDQMVGFSYGAPVRSDVFAIHIEKADKQFDGSYSVLNQEFASHIPEQYTYLNREEDLGFPGLRKSKLSYQPAFLLQKELITLQPIIKAAMNKEKYVFAQLSCSSNIEHLAD